MAARRSRTMVLGSVVIAVMILSFLLVAFLLEKNHTGSTASLRATEGATAEGSAGAGPLDQKPSDNGSGQARGDDFSERRRVVVDAETIETEVTITVIEVDTQHPVSGEGVQVDVTLDHGQKNTLHGTTDSDGRWLTKISSNAFFETRTVATYPGLKSSESRQGPLPASLNIVLQVFPATRIYGLILDGSDTPQPDACVYLARLPSTEEWQDLPTVESGCDGISLCGDVIATVEADEYGRFEFVVRLCDGDQREISYNRCVLFAFSKDSISNHWQRIVNRENVLRLVTKAGVCVEFDDPHDVVNPKNGDLIFVEPHLSILRCLKTASVMLYPVRWTSRLDAFKRAVPQLPCGLEFELYLPEIGVFFDENGGVPRDWFVDHYDVDSKVLVVRSHSNDFRFSLEGLFRVSGRVMTQNGALLERASVISPRREFDATNEEGLFNLSQWYTNGCELLVRAQNHEDEWINVADTRQSGETTVHVDVYMSEVESHFLYLHHLEKSGLSVSRLLVRDEQGVRCMPADGDVVELGQIHGSAFDVLVLLKNDSTGDRGYLLRSNIPIDALRCDVDLLEIRFVPNLRGIIEPVSGGEISEEGLTATLINRITDGFRQEWPIPAYTVKVRDNKFGFFTLQSGEYTLVIAHDGRVVGEAELSIDDINFDDTVCVACRGFPREAQNQVEIVFIDSLGRVLRDYVVTLSNEYMIPIGQSGMFVPDKSGKIVADLLEGLYFIRLDYGGNHITKRLQVIDGVERYRVELE